MRRRPALAVLAALAIASILAGTGAAATGSGALTQVKALGGGGGHALAVKSDGSAWAWGYDVDGQLGIGRAGQNVPTPTQVQGLTGVAKIAGGELHTLAVKKDGTVFAWGNNEKGQLGTGQKGSSQPSPVRVGDLKAVTAVDADGSHSYALLSNGTVRAWGENAQGALGDGTTTDTARPKTVRGLSGIVAIAAGYHHTLALTGAKAGAQKGAVYAWGDAQYGQLGNGKSCKPGSTSCDVLHPVRASRLAGTTTAIAAGQLGDYSLALMDDGTVMSWGRNDENQLGRGANTTSGCKCLATPGRVQGLSQVRAIAASGGAGAALRSDGTVWVWGNNKFGQLGSGKLGGTSGTPAQVKGLSGVRAIEAGGGYILALKADRSLVAWGINSFGELGIGNTDDSATPVAVGVAQSASHASLHVSSTLLLAVLGATVVALLGMLVLRRGRPAAPAGWHPAPPAYPTGGVQVGTFAGAPAFQLATPTARAGGSPEPQDLDGARRAYGRRVRLLSRVDLFAGASHEVLADVATLLNPRSVAAGDVVCEEGELGDEFFIVEAGTVGVFKQAGGAPRELARLGPGEFFGELALLGTSHRSATVRAVTDAELWTLSAAELQEILGRHPEIEDLVRRAARQRENGVRSGAFEVEEHVLTQVGGARERIGLGRSPDNAIVFASPLVSRHHAVIESTGGGFRLRDLDSQNGTYVNRVRVGTAELADGDEIWVGDQRFIFDRSAIRRSVEPRGIRLDATGVGTSTRGGKTLLHDVDLSILPGEFVAIVGGSGAGKTTLMDALSGVRPPRMGRVLYNGHDYYRTLPLYRNVLGYVPQDDIIHTELPLRATLRHAARLRLPPDTSSDELADAVGSALDELHLTAQADVQVGLLSGGQRKRSSIGVELLTKPRIFFLDEPTSGLDPRADAQMMRLLRRLADDGSTVILTTHATKNVMLCDKVVFLAPGGHVGFVGTPRRALRYFDADAFDAIYERLADEATPDEWSRRFHASEDFRRLRAEQLEPDPAEDQATARRSRGGRGARGGLRASLHQLRVLTRRGFDLLARNPRNLPSLVMPPILFTLLALALFHSGAFEQTANSAASLQIVFLIAFSAFVFGLLFAVQDIVKEFPVFRREHMVGVGTVPYVLAKFVLFAPLLTVLLIAMIGILRLTGRLPDSGLDVYWKLLLTVVLTGFVGLALALLTSALARSPQQATDMLSVWIMPQVLFGGALLAVPAMNTAGRILAAVAPVRWCFEALGHIINLDTQFRTDTSRIGAGLAIEYGDSFTRNPAQNWAILGVFIVVPLALTCVVLGRRTAPGGRRVAPPPERGAAATPSGSLAIVEGPGAGRRVNVEARLLVGRDPAADVVIEDPEMSARHAAFLPADGGVTVEDVGSTNGTFVNGDRLEGQRALRPGDRVQLGATVLEVAVEPPHRRRGRRPARAATPNA